MKCALTLFAVLISGIGEVAVTTSSPALAVVYCTYIAILRIASQGREGG